MLKLAAKKFYRRVFEPTFDELTLFVLAYTCVLLIGVNTFRSIKSVEIHQSMDGLVVLLPATTITFGIALSLYHAFSRRKKGRLEKQIMFLFASLVTGFAGIWGGTYLLSNSEKWSWVLVFPVINIVSSFLILGSKNRVLDERCIDDRNVTITEVAFSAAIVTTAYFITAHYLHYHWAATLSICVAYGTNLNRLIINILLRRQCKLADR